MVLIETFIGMARYLSPRNDDDWSDRMHYLYTPNILLAFSILVSFKQFGGRPLECMFPNKFPGSWEQYAENYCWAQDTYFVEPEKHVELLREEERMIPERQLSYYQWVPFLLLLQAAFFRAPSLIWKYFSNQTGIRIHEVVEKARDAANVDEESKDKNVAMLEKHLKRALRFQRRMERKQVVVHKTCTCLNYQYSAGFITSVYLFTKLLYLCNVVIQLWLMNYFLETNKYNWYGYGVIWDLVRGVRWETSGYFPRVSVCDFTVRQVANIQKYSVQCVLVINIFNEKIFVLLWFWYLILFVASVFSFISWFMLMSFPCFSRWFITQHLELSSLQDFNPKDRKHVDNVYKFVHGYLHRDGVFVLRMVSAHAGVIFATDLVLALWKEFYGIEKAMLESDKESPDLKDQNRKNSHLRNRKAKNIKSFIENEEFQTHLLPLSPPKEGESSTSSSEDEKRRERTDDPPSTDTPKSDNSDKKSHTVHFSSEPTVSPIGSPDTPRSPERENLVTLDELLYA